MSFKILSSYFLLLAFLAGCMGSGNQELQEATFGMQLKIISGGDQVLEDPETLAEDIVVKVISEDGSPSRNSKVTFKLLNTDSGANLLSSFAVTDSQGLAKTQVIGANDFGKSAQIRVSVSGTNLSKVVEVKIRNKIVPTKIQIVDPPSQIVAGTQFQVMLRLVDANGRLAEDEEFSDGMEITVNFNSTSNHTNDPTRFNKTAGVDRIVTFEDGIGYLQSVTHKTAENLAVSLYDHGTFVDLIESKTGRGFTIADTKTFSIVPDVPVRAQLEDPADQTTDDTLEAEAMLYDQYDNHAYNYGGACTLNVAVSGNNANEAWILDNSDPNLRNQTGPAPSSGGSGRFSVRDTNVETVTMSIANIASGCAGVTNLGTPVQVDFLVGAVNKIVLRQPVAPNDQATTTQEISVNVEATDNGGNLTTNFNGKVGIDFDAGCSANINNLDEEVADSQDVRMAAGQKTFRVYNRSLDRKPSEVCTLSIRGTADTTNISNLTSQIVLTFVPGAPKQFAFVNLMNTGEVGWGTAPAQRNNLDVSLEVLDTWNNPIVSGGAGVSVYVMSDGSSEIVSAANKRQVTFNSAGKGTLSFYNTKNETVNLTLLDGTAGMAFNTSTATTESVQLPSTNYQAQAYFKWGITDQVVIINPADGNVDAPINVRVEMRDYGGNIVQDFGSATTPRTEFKLYSTNSATAGYLDDLEFVNGVDTIRVTNNVEETVDLALTYNTGITSFNNMQGIAVKYNSAEDVYFKWGDASRKFVIEDPADVTVDQKVTLKVQVQDQFGNPVRDYGCGGATQDIQLTVDKGRLSANGSFDHRNEGAYSALAQSSYIDIKQQSGTCPISDPKSETTKDASFGEIHLFARTILPFDSDFQVITATLTDSAGTGYSLSPAGGIQIQFSPGAVKEYQPQANTGTVDNPIQVAIYALDQFGNKVTNYAASDAVTFRWDFQGSDPANLASINLNPDGIPANGDERDPGDLLIDFKGPDRGAGYISLSATKAETLRVGLELKAPFVTSGEADIEFQAGVVTKINLAANVPNSQITTDAKVPFKLEALDQYDNLNTNYDDGDIQVNVTRSAKILRNPTETDPAAYNLGRPEIINITNGVGDFMAYDPVTETVTFSMIDNLARGLTLSPLDVTFLHGVPDKVTVAQIQATNILYPSIAAATTDADTPALIKLQVQDKNGNIADSYSGNNFIIYTAGTGVNSEFTTTLPVQNDIPSAGTAAAVNFDIVAGEAEVYLLARAVGNTEIYLEDNGDGLNPEPASDETYVTIGIEHGATKRFAILNPGVENMTPGTLDTFPISTLTGTADNNIPLSVLAFDYYNNKATSDSASEVTFAIDQRAFVDGASVDPAFVSVLGGTPYQSARMRMNMGQAYFDVRDYFKESGILATLVNPSDITTDVTHTRSINNNFGNPAKFQIEEPVGTASVDDYYDSLVYIRDSYGNLVDNGFEGYITYEVDGDAFLNDQADQDANGEIAVGDRDQQRVLTFPPGNTGSAVMRVWDRKAENVTLSLVDGTGVWSNGAGTPSVGVDINQTIKFVSGYPKSFTLQPLSTIDGTYHVDTDNALEIVAKAYDKFGNYCNNFTMANAIRVSLSSANGSAYVASSSDIDTADPDTDVDFGFNGHPEGEGRFLMRNKKKEDVTITLNDILPGDGIVWTANTIVAKVKWGAPKVYHIGTVIGDDPFGNNGTGALRADVDILVQAIVKDDYGNVAEDYSAEDVSINVTGDVVSYPLQTSSTWSNGIAVLRYNQRKTGPSQVRIVDPPVGLTLRDYVQEGANSQSTVTIIAGSPAKFAYVDPIVENPALDILAGDELVVNLEAQDFYGNRALSFEGASADVKVRYAAGTGEIKDGSNNFVSSVAVPVSFTGGTASAVFKNEVLDRADSGFPNYIPVEGETVTLGFEHMSDTTSFTNDANPMNITGDLDVIFYPNTSVKLTLVDFKNAGPYPIDDPVALRVEARDEFGNYNSNWTGNFSLGVDQSAWTFQGASSSAYTLANTAGQNTAEQTQAKTIAANGYLDVLVANLKVETGVNISVATANNGITTYENITLDWMHGAAKMFDIDFTAQSGIEIPKFNTDKVREIDVRALDKGENIVLSYSGNPVRVKSSGSTDFVFEGDNAGDDGNVSFTSGIAQIQYLSKVVGLSTLTLDTAAPGLNGLANTTKQVEFEAGTVSQLVLVTPDATQMSADHVLISDATEYGTPTCNTSPGAQVCPYPTKVFQIQPQDQYGNLNNIEGPGKIYQVTLTAHEAGNPGNVVWAESLEIVEGIAYLDYGNDTLFAKRLYKAQGVDFFLSNPTPASQTRDGNSVPVSIASTKNINVNAGVPTRLFIKQPSDGTIDNPIPVTVEVQDAYDIDGNGNGNLVTTAGEMTVGIKFYKPGTIAAPVATGITGKIARNSPYVDGGQGQKDSRDNQAVTGDDVMSGSLLTVRSGIAMLDISDMTAEDVEVTLIDSEAGSMAEGTNGIYFTQPNLPAQPKNFKFDPGVPQKYKIIASNGTAFVLYDDANTHGDFLTRFEFEVQAFDQGNNFTPSQNGWANITINNSGGGNMSAYATPDPGNDDGTSVSTTNGIVTKNVQVSNGVGIVNFSAEKSGTASLTVASTSGLAPDPAPPSVTINPGPGVAIVLQDPEDKQTTLSTDVSDSNVATAREEGVVTAQGVDYFGNTATDINGTINLGTDSGTTITYNSFDATTSQFIFNAGSPALSTLKIENTVAETVNLTLITPSFGAATYVLPDTDGGDSNTPQDIIFSPGPTAQLSLEIDDDWDDNIKEDHTTTNATADNTVNLKVRTRDIYGNFTTTSHAGEAVVTVTPREGTGVWEVNGANTGTTLGVTAGEVAFTSQLKEFGANNFEALVAGNAGFNGVIDWIDVTLASTSGFPIYNSGAGGTLKNPRRLFFKSGVATAATIPVPFPEGGNPGDDISTDDDVIVTLYARDQYGNVDINYGDGSTEYALVKTDVVEATIHNFTTGVADEKAYFNAGIAKVKLKSSKAGDITLTMQDDGGSLAGISPTALNPLQDSKFDNTQVVTFEPGAPKHFIFTGDKKLPTDLLDVNGGTPADIIVTEDNDNITLNIDSQFYIYFYSTDQYGNITTQLTENDRLSNFSFNKGDATFVTGDALFKDFVNGEGRVLVSRTKTTASDGGAPAGYATLEFTLAAGDNGNITGNKARLDFDHGKTTHFAWDIPTTETPVDSYIDVTITARDQYDNPNDNYVGTANFAGTPNETVLGDPLSKEPYVSSTGDNTDVDPTDGDNFQDGFVGTFVAGAINFKVMSLRALDYTLALSGASITADSAPTLPNSNEVAKFKHGVIAQYEIFDILDGTYNEYDSFKQTINLNMAADGVNDLTTDDEARVGIQALDRGGNRVVGFNQASALKLKVKRSSDSSPVITADGIIDLYAMGATPWNPATGDAEYTVHFVANAVAEVRMRSKEDITYSLYLDNIVGGKTEKFAGQDKKEITFKNGSVSQIVFISPTDATKEADQNFTLAIEAQDQFGNKAIDYTGYVKLGYEVSPGVIAQPGDGNFPSELYFPGVADGKPDGSIKMTNGDGALSGYEYHLAPSTVTLVVIEDSLDINKDTIIGNATSFKHSISITHGAPTQITWSTLPADSAVDSNANFQLRIGDTYGNLCSTTTETIKLLVNGTTYGETYKKIGGSTGDDALVTPGNDITITNGIQTFSIWSQKSENVDLSLGSAPAGVTYPAVTKSFKFVAGPAVDLKFAESDYTTLDADGVTLAGDTYRVYMVGRDQFENIATGFNGNVDLDSSNDIFDLTALTAVSFTEGKAFLDVSSSQMGSAPIAFGNINSGGGTIVDKAHTHTVEVDHNVATKFGMSSDKDTYTIDEHAAFIVQAQDAYDNPVDDYQGGSITIGTANAVVYQPVNHLVPPAAAGDNDALRKYQPGRVFTADAAGKINFYVDSYVAEDVTLTIVASTDNLTPTQKEITFDAGAAEHFEIQTPSIVSGTFHGDVDDKIRVEIKALDRGKANLAETYTKVDALTVAVSATDSNIDVYKDSDTPAGVPGNGTPNTQVDFSSGLGYVDIRSQKNQEVVTTISVDAAEGGQHGIDKTISFDHGALNKAVFLGSSSALITADNSATLNVQTQDQYGNHYNNFNGNIDVAVDQGELSHNNSTHTDGFGVAFPVTTSYRRVAFTLGNGTTNVGVTQTGGVYGGIQTVTFRFKLISGAPAAISGTIGSAGSKHDLIVQPGAVDTYVLRSHSGNFVVGNEQLLQMHVEDQHGNLIDNASGSGSAKIIVEDVGNADPVDLDFNRTGSYTSGGEVVNVASGMGNFYINSTKAQLLKFRIDPTSVGGKSISGTTQFTYRPDHCVAVLIDNAATENATVDTQHILNFTANDQYGNIDTTCNETFSLVAAAGAGFSLGDWEAGKDPRDISFTNSGATTAEVHHHKGETGFNIVFTMIGQGGLTNIAPTEKLTLYVDHGEASYFDFALNQDGHPQNYNITENIPFDIFARDQYGNTNDDYDDNLMITSTDIYVGRAGNPTAKYVSNQTYSGAGFTNGVFSFNAETTKTGPFSLKIGSSTHPTITTQQTVTVNMNPGPPVLIGLLEPSVGKPANPAKVDAKVLITAKVYDIGGNIATNFNGGSLEVLLTSNSGPGAQYADLTNNSTFSSENDPFEQTNTTNFVNGSANIYVKSTKIAGYNVAIQTGSSVPSAAEAGKESQDISFIPGGAKKIMFYNNQATATADDFFSLTVRAYDQFDNYVDDFSGSNVVIQGDSGQQCTAPTSGPWGNDGEITFTDKFCRKAGNGVWSIVSENSGLNLDTSDTYSILISHGAPDRFQVRPVTNIGVSSDASPSTGSVMIDILDDYSNVCTSSTETVSFNTTGGVSTADINVVGHGSMSSPLPLTITGTAQVDLHSETAQEVTAFLNNPSGSLNTGSNKSFSFEPGTATQFAFKDTSFTQTTIDSYTLEIEARDEFDNKATTYGGGAKANITISPNSTGLIGSLTNIPFVEGVATKTVQKTVPTDPAVFTITDPDGAGPLTVNGGPFYLTVEPGPPAKIDIGGIPAVVKATDNAINVVYTLTDMYGNETTPDNSYTATARVNGQAKFVVGNSSTKAISWSNGGLSSTTLTWYDRKAENVALTLDTASGGLDYTHGGANAAATVGHGVGHHWAFPSVVADSTTDANAIVTAKLEDEYDNLCTGNSGKNVSLAATYIGGGFSNVVTVDANPNSFEKDISSGVATFLVNSTAKGTLQLAMTNGSGSSFATPGNEQIDIEWGAPAAVNYTTVPTAIQTGLTSHAITFEMLDGNGNKIQGYNTGNNIGYGSIGNAQLQNAGFTSNGAEGSTPSPPTGFGQAAWSGGVANFTLLNPEYAGSLTVNAKDLTSGSIAALAQTTITIDAGTASNIYVVAPSQKGIVSQTTNVTVYMLDQFNNYVDYSGTLNFCMRPSDVSDVEDIYNDDSHVMGNGYHSGHAQTQSCKNFSFSNESTKTFNIRKKTDGEGFGWVNLYVNNPPGGMSMSDVDGVDFYFQPGDPVEYKLILPSTPTAGLFHSTVSGGTRAASHIVTGVPAQIDIEAIDVTGATAQTWGGVATISVNGDAYTATGLNTVDLTQGEGNFDLIDQFVEDVTITVTGSSDGSVKVHGQGCTDCQKVAKVSRSKAQTFKVRAWNNGTMSWPDSSTSKARISHNTGDKISLTAEVLDEGGARFTEYTGKFFYGSDAGYYRNFDSFDIANGVKTGGWSRDYRPTSKTPSMNPHPDFGSRVPAGISFDNDTINFVHGSPESMYVYCPPGELVKTADTFASCRLKIRDGEYHNSSSNIINDTWGANVVNFEGGQIDISLRDNTNAQHPNAIVYPDDNNNNVIEAGADDHAGKEGTRGSNYTLNFQSGKGIYYFGVNSNTEGNVKIVMKDGKYDGNKWHTYLGISANTLTAWDNAKIKYQEGTADYTSQSVFFLEAPTSEFDLSIVANGAPVNPSVDGSSEYYTATLTAKTSNGSTNLNEDGYVYLDLNGTGTSDEIAGANLYMKAPAINGGSGSYSNTNSMLVQFADGVATVDVYASAAGDINLRMRHPGSSSVTLSNNNQVRDFQSNPATKYLISAPASDIVANGLAGQTLEVRAVDADDNVDTTYVGALTLELKESVANDSDGDIDANNNGTKGDTTVSFVGGIATVAIMTTDAGSHTLTATGAFSDVDHVFTVVSPTATQIVEVGTPDTSNPGEVTFSYEAQDALGNLDSNFTGFWTVVYDISNSSTSESDSVIFFTAGLGELTIKSTKAQTITASMNDITATGLDFIDTPVNTEDHTFTGGYAVALRLASQPAGNVTVNDVLSSDTIVELVDGDNNRVTSDDSTEIEVIAHDGAGCSSEIGDSSFTDNGTYPIDDTVTSGAVTWSQFKSSADRVISLEVKDTNGDFNPLCSNSFTVYRDLTLTVDGAVTGAVTASSVIVEIDGGVPPYTLNLTHGNGSSDSTASIVTSAEPGCDGAYCIKWTAGKFSATDNVSVDDSQSVPSANTLDVDLDVEAAEFTFDDNDTPTLWGATNDLGAFDNSSDHSFEIKIENLSTYASGTLTHTLTAGELSMWNLNDVNCASGSGSIAGSGNCILYMTFKSNSGAGSVGSHTMTLTVNGPNDSAHKEIQFTASKLKSVEIQNPDNGNAQVQGTNFNLGAHLTTGSDVTKTFRVQNNESVSTGNLTVTLDDPQSSMFEVVSDLCTGNSLANGATCNVTVRFKANTGANGVGVYDATFTVDAADTGVSSMIIDAEAQ